MCCDCSLTQNFKLNNEIVKFYKMEKSINSMEQIEKLVQEIEKKIETKGKKEIYGKKIGELVMKKLYRLDEVAYVRFASVYRQFKDISQFMSEVKGLLGKQ